MNQNNCPCPKNGCGKTTAYLIQNSTNWNVKTCPHCGCPMAKNSTKDCSCVVDYCPCKGMTHMPHKHAGQKNCPCIQANCGCLA